MPHASAPQQRTVLTRDIRDALLARGNGALLPEIRKRLLPTVLTAPFSQAAAQR